MSHQPLTAVFKDQGEFLRGGIMELLKEATIETIKRLPDGCSPEDIMYRVNLVAQILEGIRDADAGRCITTDELLDRVDQWAK
jgi:hypothetical protein